MLMNQHTTINRARAVADRMGEAVRQELGEQRLAPEASGTRVARPG